MRRFFKKHKLDETEMSAVRVDKIKSRVLNEIKEDKPMKHFSIKPLLIAAAISVGTAASLITANAATDGAITDGIKKTVTFLFGDKEIEAEYSSYSDESADYEEYTFDVPDDGSEFGVRMDNDEPPTIINYSE